MPDLPSIVVIFRQRRFRFLMRAPLVCSVFFSHRTIHWGSKGRPGSSHGPRISISFAASDPAFKVKSF